MPAAGRGLRFGAQLPKQYAPLAGRTVIEWALAPFVADPRCRGIAVAVAPGDARWPRLAARTGARELASIAGGAERCDSVLNALGALPAADEDWVLVHDAARPCVSGRELDALLGRLADHPVGGLLALPLADTLKRGDEAGVVAATLPRAGLWRALTPQMFRAGLLREALRDARERGVVPTDESQAIEWRGLKPQLVAGESSNLKITTAADLAWAEILLRTRQEQA